MSNQENQQSNRIYKIYIHRIKTWVEVTKEQHDAYYRDIWATRKRAQSHGQCMCPKSKTWICDGDCLACEFRAAGDNLSLDYTIEDNPKYSILECKERDATYAAPLKVRMRLRAK